MQAKGFTLAEVVMSTLLAGIILVALAMTLAQGLRLVELNRNTLQATADVRVVTEEMARLSEASLTAVTAVDWTAWAAGQGLTSLPAEVLVVAYVNANADPLQATVTVQWVERGRNRSIQMTELLTSR